MKLKGFKGGLFTANGKPQALTPSEANVSKSIQNYLDVRHIYNDRINSGQVEVVKKFVDKRTGQMKEYRNWLLLAKRGTPDRFAIVPNASGHAGFIVFIEVKMKGKKPTPEQIERHEELRKAGAIIIVADSLDSFISQFNELFEESSIPN